MIHLLRPQPKRLTQRVGNLHFHQEPCRWAGSKPGLRSSPCIQKKNEKGSIYLIGILPWAKRQNFFTSYLYPFVHWPVLPLLWSLSNNSPPSKKEFLPSSLGFCVKVSGGRLGKEARKRPTAKSQRGPSWLPAQRKTDVLLLGAEWCPFKHYTLKSSHPGPQDVTGFGESIFKEVIKLKLGENLIPMTHALRSRINQDTDTERGSCKGTGEGLLRLKEKDLRRNQACQHLNQTASRSGRK